MGCTVDRRRHTQSCSVRFGDLLDLHSIERSPSQGAPMDDEKLWSAQVVND